MGVVALVVPERAKPPASRERSSAVRVLFSTTEISIKRKMTRLNMATVMPVRKRFCRG